uniref:hypothetical protein n=1 Tax=Acinetobacter baumannii TaxID=470 RepID=UPI001C072F01
IEVSKNQTTCIGEMAHSSFVRKLFLVSLNFKTLIWHDFPLMISKSIRKNMIRKLSKIQIKNLISQQPKINY